MSNARVLAIVPILAIATACATGRAFFPPDSAARPAEAAPRQFHDAHMMAVTSQMVPMGNVPASAPGSATSSRTNRTVGIVPR